MSGVTPLLFPSKIDQVVFRVLLIKRVSFLKLLKFLDAFFVKLVATNLVEFYDAFLVKFTSSNFCWVALFLVRFAYV